jgi:hypothetical protein
MHNTFDPADCIRSPVITLSSGVTLALALVDACPKNAPPNVKKGVQTPEDDCRETRDLLAERNRELGTISDEDSRILDNEADRAWGGLRMRLQAMNMLAPKDFPKAKRAAELDAQLFAEGMELLKVEYWLPSSSTSMTPGSRRTSTTSLAPTS